MHDISHFSSAKGFPADSCYTCTGLLANALLEQLESMLLNNGQYDTGGRARLVDFSVAILERFMNTNSAEAPARNPLHEIYTINNIDR